MTPDLVAELMRQLMSEAMILAAPLLIAAAVLSFVLSLVQTLDQSAGAVAHQRAAAGRDRADSAGGDAVVSGAACHVHAAAVGRFSPLPGVKQCSRSSSCSCGLRARSRARGSREHGSRPRCTSWQSSWRLQAKTNDATGRHF